MVKTREQARAAKEEQRARQREEDAAVLAGANGAGGGGGGGAEAAKAGAGTAAAKGSSAHGESEALARFALVFVEVLAWCVFWSSIWVGGFNVWYFVGRTFGGKGQGEGTAAAVGVPPAVPHSGAVPGAAAASGVTMPPADPDLPRSGETGEYYASTGAATEDPTGMQYVEVEAGGVGDEAGGGDAPGSGA